MKAKTLLILIVEDEMPIAMDIEARLTKMGYGITGIAITKEEAISCFMEDRPDIVLQDIQLGNNQDGFVLSEYFSSHGCPVVFLTAFGDMQTFSKALSTSPAGYVTKPFKDDDLHRQIELAHKKQLKIREIEEMLHLFEHSASNSDVPTLLGDAEGRILKINGAMEKLSGYLDSEVFKQSTNLFFNLKHLTDEITHLKHRNKQLVAFSAKLTPVYQDQTEICIGYTLEVKGHPMVSEQSSINAQAAYIREKSVLYRVPIEHIYWLEAMDNYTKIHTLQKTYTIKQFLKDTLQKLPSDRFIRIHRSYAVAVEHVSMLEDETLYCGKTSLPIGGQYWNEIRSRLNFL
ncbi:MAG: LytTR family transcriptional regulator DNA-binding domain-containing protein [Bacteroidia bacterium]